MLTEAQREAGVLYEKEPKRQKRQVLHREKKIGELQEQLQTSTAEVEKLRDLKKVALREAIKIRASSKELLKHLDAAVAKSTGLVESFKELKNKTERDGGKGCLPHADKFEAKAVSCMATGISAQQCRGKIPLNNN
jgi:hypothetical protein